jgi:hypothetical protein
MLSYIRCQRGSARQCCKGHVSFLWEKPIVDTSQKPNPLSYTTKIYTIDYVGDLNRCANFHCNRLDKGTPHAYVKYNDFVTFFILILFYLVFFVLFSRNRVTAERSVAQKCMMAQTTWFGARTCLFGVSLMYACIKGSRIP